MPTERPDVVRTLIEQWFAGDVAETASGLQMQCDDLTLLRRRIWELEIIDTMRTHLQQSIREGIIHCTLDKQAAVAGKISIPAGTQTLGVLQVNIRCSDPEALIAWLCPETADGQVVRATLDDPMPRL